MLHYFPFDERYTLTMGTFPLKETDCLVEVDEHYTTEIAEKRRLLAEDYYYYYQTLPETYLAQWEVLEKVLQNLATSYPVYFELVIEGEQWHWYNRLLNEKHSFRFKDNSSLPLEPLDWVGRQVQEDLLLLANDETITLNAGQLCFPNDWDLGEKFGKSFLDIHTHIPKVLGPMMMTAQKLMERLLPHRPVWRLNWNFKIHNALDMSSKYFVASRKELAALGPTLTSETIGERLYLRVERQTLTRLPQSGYILFGIHTYQNTLANEAKDPDRARRMYQVLESAPREVIQYKAIPFFEEALMKYLKRNETL